jgi:hypothetical protein
MLCGLSETTMAGDVPPVMTATPAMVNPATAAKRKVPVGTKKKDMRSRMASRIIGEDSRDDYVIPDNAKEVDTLEVAGDGLTNIKKPELPGEKPKNPYSGEEPLILPAASLVAPDVTPEALYPLDPSQIPGADAGKAPSSAPQPAPMAPAQPFGATAPSPGTPSSPALDLVLGKEPQMSTEALMAKLPGIPAPGSVAAMEAETSAGGITLGQGEVMPEHKANPGGAWKAFCKLAPIPVRQING